MELSAFETVAPYLQDPLILSGFALFLFFGALRFVIKRLPIVTRKIAGITVLRLVTFSFILAFAVIVLGFVLRGMEVWSDAARAAAEHRARLAEQAVNTLERQLALSERNFIVVQEQSKALTAAVTALAQSKGPGIDAALEALANKDTAKAKAIFRRITESQAANIREAAAAQRHLGALAFLDDTQAALVAYRRATELEPENVDGWENLGILYMRTGQLDEAVLAYQKVMEFGLATNDRRWQANAYGNLGIVYEMRDDLEKAEAMHNKALAIDEELGRKAGLANAYGNLGNVYRKLGKLDQAEEMLKKALAIEEELGRIEGMTLAYNNLGFVYQLRDQLDQAEAMHNKALAISERFGLKEGVALAYNALGVVYQLRGHLDQAEAVHNKALAIYEEFGHKEGMADAYGNLGIMYGMRGDIAQAEAMLMKALALYRDLGSSQARRVQSFLDNLKKMAEK